MGKMIKVSFDHINCRLASYCFLVRLPSFFSQWEMSLIWVKSPILLDYRLVSQAMESDFPFLFQSFLMCFLLSYEVVC